METSRGRWFLGEYAKRNRNADTRMVLDAVARIEETLAAQKHADAGKPPARALAAIRRPSGRPRPPSPVRSRARQWRKIWRRSAKRARIIREISWRWREIGADAPDLRPDGFPGQRHRRRAAGKSRATEPAADLRRRIRSDQGADCAVRERDTAADRRSPRRPRRRLLPRLPRHRIKCVPRARKPRRTQRRQRTLKPPLICRLSRFDEPLNQWK